MKCTQYELNELVAFKIARAILLFQSRVEQATIFSWDLKNLDLFCGGCLQVPDRLESS